MALRVDDPRGGSEWVGGRVILRQRSVSMDKRQTVANGRSNGVAKCQQYIVGSLGGENEA